MYIYTYIYMHGFEQVTLSPSGICQKHTPFRSHTIPISNTNRCQAALSFALGCCRATSKSPSRSRAFVKTPPISNAHCQNPLMGM